MVIELIVRIEILLLIIVLLSCSLIIVWTLYISCSISLVLLKGHNMQHSGKMGQYFSDLKTIEIQLVRPTEVCGKV